jgi:dihydroflavonol-4-reductase
MPADYWAGRRVVLTGATGFLGQHLAALLLRQGARLVALTRASSSTVRLAGAECVVAPLDDLSALTRGCAGAEVVFHLAGAVDFGTDWPRFHAVNVRGTANVAAAARAAGVSRLVHTSSIVAVGASASPTVLDESAHWDLGRLRVPYVTTKRLAEEEALAAGLDVVVVNPSCVLGPDDFTRSEFGTLCRRFWHGRLPFYSGAGSNFVDVRDVADGMLRAAQHGRAGQRYLLTGHNLTYDRFFGLLARTARRPIFRVRLPGPVAQLGARLAGCLARPGKRPYLTPGQARLLERFFWFDAARAHRELGYRARPLTQTLHDTFSFWKAA